MRTGQGLRREEKGMQRSIYFFISKRVSGWAEIQIPIFLKRAISQKTKKKLEKRVCTGQRRRRKEKGMQRSIFFLLASELVIFLRRTRQNKNESLKRECIQVKGDEGKRKRYIELCFFSTSKQASGWEWARIRISICLRSRTSQNTEKKAWIESLYRSRTTKGREKEKNRSIYAKAKGEETNTNSYILKKRERPKHKKKA